MDSKQTFDFLCVIDFECTCERGVRDWVHEIIEFPAVLMPIGRPGVSNQEFHHYVRPIEKPVLTQFCTELTGVTQAQVKASRTLAETLDLFDAWLQDQGVVATANGPAKYTCAFASDGPWDFKHFLEAECTRKRIPRRAYFDSWVNLRWLFAAHHKAKRRLGVEGMLEFYGLKFEGRPHSGIDDTRNIARIAHQLAAAGCILSINDGLDPSLAVQWQARSPDSAESKGGKARGRKDHRRGRGKGADPLASTPRTKSRPAVAVVAEAIAARLFRNEPSPRSGSGAGSGSGSRSGSGSNPFGLLAGVDELDDLGH